MVPGTEFLIELNRKFGAARRKPGSFLKICKTNALRLHFDLKFPRRGARISDQRHQRTISAKFLAELLTEEAQVNAIGQNSPDP
jgi:hypothetical protein